MEFGEQIILTEEDRQALAPMTDASMFIPAPETVEQFPTVFELYEVTDISDLIESRLATKAQQLQGLKRARDQHRQTEVIFQLRQDINILELAQAGLREYTKQKQPDAPPRSF